MSKLTSMPTVTLMKWGFVNLHKSMVAVASGYSQIFVTGRPL